MNISTSTQASFRQELAGRLLDASQARERRRARSLFSPALAYGRHHGPPLPSAKPAAVMIVLEPKAGSWTIPLTVRPQHLPDHPGQISLPGGRVENGESRRAAAIREFAEEMGVRLQAEIVGHLEPVYVFNSNYDVLPFLAVAEAELSYRPCIREVDRILHLSVDNLLDPASRRAAVFQRGLVSWRAPVIACGPDQIWGATAVMLGELSVLLRGMQLPDLSTG